MVEIFGRTFEHLTIVRAVGDPVTRYHVRTEEGYYIHKPTFEENLYKTSTIIYPTDDVDGIIIIPESELPEGAEILAGKPNTEVASADEETPPETA